LPLTWYPANDAAIGITAPERKYIRQTASENRAGFVLLAWFADAAMVISVIGTAHRVEKADSGKDHDPLESHFDRDSAYSQPEGLMPRL
jgi:hypothetical protein